MITQAKCRLPYASALRLCSLSHAYLRGLEAGFQAGQPAQRVIGMRAIQGGPRDKVASPRLDVVRIRVEEAISCLCSETAISANA
jgi:hypothetical protein